MTGYPSFSRYLLIMSYTPTRSALAVETTSSFVLMFGTFANKTNLFIIIIIIIIYFCKQEILLYRIFRSLQQQIPNKRQVHINTKPTMLINF